MKELIIRMAQALVDNPDKVAVFEVNGGQTSVFELKVAKEDLGQVIGKRGETAKAMRIIVSAVASKLHQKSFLEIIKY